MKYQYQISFIAIHPNTTETAMTETVVGSISGDAQCINHTLSICSLPKVKASHLGRMWVFEPKNPSFVNIPLDYKHQKTASDCVKKDSLFYKIERIEQKEYNPLLTGELYNSPNRDQNEAKYGIRAENQCICCMKPVKSGQFKMVHLNTNMNILHKLVKPEISKELTGAESQGFFEVGNDCAKKMKNGFIHPAFATATA